MRANSTVMTARETPLFTTCRTTPLPGNVPVTSKAEMPALSTRETRRRNPTTRTIANEASALADHGQDAPALARRDLPDDVEGAAQFVEGAAPRRRAGARPEDRGHDALAGLARALEHALDGLGGDAADEPLDLGDDAALRRFRPEDEPATAMLMSRRGAIEKIV
jgi:hypothetical protein